jgi:hypothetical protein
MKPQITISLFKLFRNSAKRFAVGWFPYTSTMNEDNIKTHKLSLDG